MEIEDKYLSVENCDETDIITFLDEGVKASIKLQGSDKEKAVYNFLVSNGRYNLTYTPGLIAQKEFMKAWGRNTSNWVNKKFTPKIVEIMSFGKMKKVIFPVPIII